MDGVTLTERWEGAEELNDDSVGTIPVTVNMWPSAQYAGHFGWLPWQLWDGSHNFTRRMRARNWFDRETIEEVAQGYDPSSFWVMDADLWEPLKVDMPPAGDWDADPSVPFSPLSTFNRGSTRLPQYTYTGDDQPVYEDVYEPDRLNVDDVFQMAAWFLNWFLPDIPIYRNMSQSHLNMINWRWGRDIPNVDGLTTSVDDVHTLWDMWGEDAQSPHSYHANNMIWGNPEEPKLGAEVRRTDN